MNSETKSQNGTKTTIDVHQEVSIPQHKEIAINPHKEVAVPQHKELVMTPHKEIGIPHHFNVPKERF